MLAAPIDPCCPYVPGIRDHAPGCNRLRHIMLVSQIEKIIDPPVYRAAIGNHEFCPLEPCADCQARP